MTAKIDMSRADSAPKGEGPVAQTKANTVDQSHDTAINDSHRVLDLDGTNDDDYVYGRRDLSRSPSPYRRPRTRTRPRMRSLSRSLSPSPSRSPSPYRHRRAADRSPSPYRHRRAADRSPSPYRHRRAADRSPSPFRHSRDDRDSRSYNKRKASPPRHNRPEKRYHSDRDLHARDAASPAGAAEKELKDLPNRAAGVNQKSFRYRNAEVENSNAVSNFKGGLAASDNVLKTNDGRVQYEHGQPQHRRKQKHDVPAPKSAPQPNVDEDAEMKITEDVADYVPVPVEEKVPTQESREEKKRRWAAIRAAAEQQKPKENLLQQAILTNASETTTPNVASPAQYADSPVSPYASPGNGNLDSVPASPDMMMTIGKEGFNQGNSPAADSPSAADYDPMQDMLDDRDRAARKNKTAEIPSAAYHETDPKLLSTLPAQKIVPVKKQKKEVDMFASDDEDDNDDAETGFGIEAPAKGTVLDEKLLDNWDDPEGYYKLIHNELVNGQRYRLIRALGRGVFANVVEAEETNAGGAPKLVAVKMIRRNEMMRKASQKEADFVRKLNESDPQDKRHIIRLLDTFDHKGHLCIVFEHMSKNLRDLLKDETSGHGLSLPAIRVYARQMFFALHHLQNCQVIHLDLKPDNVLVSADMKTIKLADFGTAVDKRDIIERTEYLVSRFYRAPEIILGMDIGYPVDMWAIGCTIYELWTGKILFNGSSNNQMIKAFMDCLGWPSEKLLRKGLANNVLENFELGPPLRFISREVDHLNRPYVRTIEQQKKIPRDMKTRVHEAARNMADLPAVSELNDLADLLSASLHLNVDKRLTPTEALKHKFFVNIPVPVRRPAPKVGPTFVNPTSVRRGTPGNRR